MLYRWFQFCACEKLSQIWKDQYPAPRFHFPSPSPLVFVKTSSRNAVNESPLTKNPHSRTTCAIGIGNRSHKTDFTRRGGETRQLAAPGPPSRNRRKIHLPYPTCSIDSVYFRKNDFSTLCLQSTPSHNQFTESERVCYQFSVSLPSGAHPVIAKEMCFTGFRFCPDGHRWKEARIGLVAAVIPCGGPLATSRN